MRIYCHHCQEKARIKSRNNLTPDHTCFDLYCECLNKECGAKFVLRASFDRCLNPQIDLQNLLSRLSEKERAVFLQDMSSCHLGMNK